MQSMEFAYTNRTMAMIIIIEYEF